MAGIKLQNVYKIYSDGFTAVDNFNLEITDKEFIVLVGPSGCGKSTTLRMIAGLEEISKGEISIGDRVVNKIPPKDRNIAMVFQSYALYPNKNVYKNMAFSLELHKMPKDEIRERVINAAKILDIEHLLDRKPRALSGGQRQRVALGRAMVRNPDVFLLDEPLSNLDAKLRAAMRTEIIKLHHDLGTTFIYVTHDQTEAMTMGDRIVVMRDGVIQQVDTPQRIYEHPVNMFVAGFIGSPQMNFISATLIQKSEGSFLLDLGESTLPICNDMHAEAFASYAGKQIIVGIRPEDISDSSTAVSEHKDSLIRGLVEVRELMGSEAYLYVKYGNERLTARVDKSSTAKADDTVILAVDENKIHLFDKETGERIG